MIKLNYHDDFEKCEFKCELTIHNELIEELPLTYKNIRTNKTVITSNHYITSLKNSPISALETFSVFNNTSLESLKGLPKKMGIFSFSGSPKALHDLWRICEAEIYTIWIGNNDLCVIDDKPRAFQNFELTDLCNYYKNAGRGRKMLEFQTRLIDLGYAD